MGGDSHQIKNQVGRVQSRREKNHGVWFLCATQLGGSSQGHLHPEKRTLGHSPVTAEYKGFRDSFFHRCSRLHTGGVLSSAPQPHLPLAGRTQQSLNCSPGGGVWVFTADGVGVGVLLNAPPLLPHPEPVGSGYKERTGLNMERENVAAGLSWLSCS